MIFLFVCVCRPHRLCFSAKSRATSTNTHLLTDPCSFSHVTAQTQGPTDVGFFKHDIDFKGEKISDNQYVSQ